MKLPKFKLPKLPRVPKPQLAEPKKLAYRILYAVIALVVIMIVVYGVGIYKYHWSRYGTKTVIRIIPYPAGFVSSNWISVSEFEFQKKFILHFYDRTGTPLDNETDLNRQIMDRLVEKNLTERELQKNKLSVSPKEVDEQYKSILDSNQGEENTKKMLGDLYGINLGEFKSLIKDKAETEKLQNEVLVSAHVNMIVIKDQNRANDVLNQLKNNGDFTELSKKYSEDETSKDSGGDIGFIGRGGVINDKPMPKDLENSIFSINVNDYPAAPVATDFGFVIFKVTEKKGKIDKSYQDWLAETKSHTKILKFIGK